MMFKLGCCIVGVCLALYAHAGDPEAGKQRATVCQSCHGQNGISPNPLWPNLAGQQGQYLIFQLKAFRDGLRKNPLMTPMAVGLSDDDIDNLAAYYSALSCAP